MKLPLPMRRSRADEAMLPLINVVFLLMVFFMLVGALTPPEALDPMPPRAATFVPVDAGGRGLVVAADGRLAFGGEVLARHDVVARAVAWQAQNPGTALQVKADAAADTQGVLDLLESLRAAGIVEAQLLAVPAGEARRGR